MYKFIISCIFKCAVLITFFWNSVFAYQNTIISDSANSNQIKSIKSEIPQQNQLIDKDSLLTQDSLTSADSIKTELIEQIELYQPLKQHGKINLIPGNVFRNINKKDLEYLEYHSLSDILMKKTQAYPLSLGSPGMFNQFSFFGASANNNGVSFNSRILTDIEYSSFNIEQLSTEFFENIEVLVGSDAVIFSDNSSGALINVQEIIYNTKLPYTKIWYSQGAYDLLSADGIFSQNFAPNMNFTFGFRRQSGNGMYKDSRTDTWNVRGLLRWNPSNQTSISLVENFSNHFLETNGGINKNISIDNYNQIVPFSSVYAIPYYEGLDEKVFRHDVTLSVSSFLSDDSLTALSGNIFFSNAIWRRRLSNNLLDDADDSLRVQNHLSRYYGANIKFEQSLLQHIIIRLGADSYFADSDKSVYNSKLNELSISGFAQTQIDLSDIFSISGGLRLRNYNDLTIFSGGVKLIIKINENMNFFTDFSKSERSPSPVENSLLKNELHNLILSEFKWTNSDFNLIIGASFRNIDSPIIFEIDDDNGLISNINADSRMIFSTYIDINGRIYKDIGYSVWARGYYSETDDKKDYRYPAVYAGMNAYYEITKGRSKLRLGASFKFLTSFKGERFLPQYRAYALSSIESGFMNDGISVFIRAKLGTAFVKLSYENILSQGYYNVPLYPNYDRHFRFAFSWPFMD